MLRVLELFSGYGGADFALKKLGIPFELVGFSEIDKYAIKIFEQNHGGKCLGDVKKIIPEELPDFDLLTGGFPCQSFSIAGQRKGKEDSRGTLFWDIIRIAEVKKPTYMLLENVKGLLSIDDGETFQNMIHELNRIGYDVRYKVLNTKDYGIPQNRDRIWFVCKYGSWDFMEFQFPKKKPLLVTLPDILEPNVDKKYFLSDNMKKKFDEYLANKKVDANTCIDAGVQRRGEWGDGVHQGTTGTLNSASGRDFMVFDGGHGKVHVDEEVCQCIIAGTFIGAFGRSGHSDEENRSREQVMLASNQLRRLTPRECFRLMGFLNDEINIANISDSQLYRIAGNGWDINVASLVLKEMLKNARIV